MPDDEHFQSINDLKTGGKVAYLATIMSSIYELGDKSKLSLKREERTG